jgi:hypothetical protein
VDGPEGEYENLSRIVVALWGGLYNEENHVKVTLFWNMTPCSLVETYQRSGGRKFFRKINNFLPDYTMSHPTGQQCSSSTAREPPVSQGIHNSCFYPNSIRQWNKEV